MNKTKPLPLLMTAIVSLGAIGCGDSSDENETQERESSQQSPGDAEPLEPEATTTTEELMPTALPVVPPETTPEETMAEQAMSEQAMSAESESTEPIVDSEAELQGSEELPDPMAPLTPRLVWRNCGQFAERNYECSELSVPVNYDDPNGEQVFVALRRIVANPLEPYRGSLLVNPGGPGGPGIDFALNVFEAGLFEVLAPGFDIIGFDPRGVAQSGERGCGIAPPNLYPGAGTVAETTLEDSIQLIRDYAEGCEEEWGPLFRAIGTNNVVRDLEEIRLALGEDRLNFLGASYGTLLGALYAHNYPETTGRIVLDAPVHPRRSMVERARGQFLETVRLHEAFLVDCENGVRQCPPEPRQVFDSLLDNARSRGLEQTLLADWAAEIGFSLDLNFPLFLLDQEATDPGGDWLSELYANAPGGVGLDVALFAVNCTDDPFEPPTFEQLELLRAEFNAISPLFAVVADRGALCMGWPTTADPTPLPTAVNAPRLLVIGGVNDSRTPYSNAQAMTETLGNATLLTSTHYGHGAFSAPGTAGQCARSTIRAYFTTGSLPALGAVCE